MISKTKAFLIILVSTVFIGLHVSTQPGFAFDEEHDSGHNTTGYGGRSRTNPTSNPRQSRGGDPVILSTGDFAYSFRDFFIPGRIPLEITRSYHSQDKYNGPFGCGWTLNYNISLIETVDRGGHFDPDSGIHYDVTKVIIRGGDSIRLEFTDMGSSVFTPPDGRFETLDRDGDGFILRKKTGHRYYFNSDGRLTSSEDRNGNHLTMGYDGSGKLTSVTDDAGRSLTLSYNSGNKVQTITDPAGRIVSYSYDVDDNLVEVANPAGNTITYGYDLDHNLLSVAGAKGFIYLSNTYDSLHRVVSQTYNGGTFTYAYDDTNTVTTFTNPRGTVTKQYLNSTGNPVKIIRDVGGIEITTIRVYDDNMHAVSETDPNVNTTGFTYDSMGNLHTVTNPQGKIITSVYEATFNQVTGVTDPMGRETTLDYDSNGNLTKSTDDSGNEQTFTYASNGDLLAYTSPLNQTTTNTYDGYGYPSTTTDHSGNTIYYSYDIVGNLAFMTDKNNNTTQYTHNQLNQITRITDALGNTLNMTYDKNGNRTAITDAQGNSTTFTYNDYNQITAITDPLGRQSTITYDKNGNRLAFTDASGKTTTNAYDSLDRLVTVTDALSNEIAFAYDANSNVTGITDAGNNTTSYTFNNLNRLTQTQYPDGSTESLTYDDDGNVLTATDRAGNTISYAYDNLNRRTTKTYPGGAQVTYTYNAIGLVTSVADSGTGATLGYVYNDLNRISRINQGTSTVSYAYDARGNKTRLTYPDESYITYTYDALNRLDQVKSQDNQVITDYTYDSIGRRIQLDLLNGTQALYQYNAAGRLTGLTNRVAATQAVISNFSYTYNNDGSRASMVTPEGTHSYTYDDLYRLTGVSYPDATSATYSFDSAGNRTSVVNGGTVSYSANTLNQYTSVGGAAYTYDGNGNLTSNSTDTYQYDFENMLIQSTVSSDTITYKYDPVGRRISKTINGTTTTKYIYDGSRVIMETDGAGAVTAKYVYGRGIDEALKRIAGGADYYYLYDGLGSVTEITDSAGSKAESYTYRVHGEPSIFDGSGGTLSQSAVGNSYLFTGRRFEKETGLYHYRARYYDPGVGRFMSPDPIRYQGGFNLYAYVKNNPVNFVDPFGLIDVMNAASTGLGFAENALNNEMARKFSSLSGRARQFGSVERARELAALDRGSRNVARIGKLGTGLTVAGAVLATYNEAGAIDRCDPSRYAQAGAVGATSLLSLNPYVGATILASEGLDYGLRQLGFEEAKAFEVVNNAGRVVAILITGDQRSGEAFLERARSGDLGSATQALTEAGDALAENEAFVDFLAVTLFGG